MKTIRTLLIGVIVALSVSLGSATAADQHPLPTFATGQAAQHHCPSDVVVWLNTRTGVYHFKGQRWYGRTRNGAYVCQKDVNASGRGRATRNGQ